MFVLTKLSRIALMLIAFCYIPATGRAAETKLPLILVSTIPLPNVSGRIDHLAVDIGRNRLFVAERGDNALDVIDLSTQKLLRLIFELFDPQALSYFPAPTLISVALVVAGSA